MQVTENWRPIAGWEGLYEVSDHGRVKSLPRNIRVRRSEIFYTSKPKILKPSKTNSGYLIVTLSFDGNQDKRLVHVLVAEAFVENPRACGFVNHDDGDKSNNHYKNLKWCTRSENMLHAFQNGLIAKRRCRRKSELA